MKYLPQLLTLHLRAEKATQIAEDDIRAMEAAYIATKEVKDFYAAHREEILKEKENIREYKVALDSL